MSTIIYRDTTFRAVTYGRRRNRRTFFEPSAADRERGIENLHVEIYKAEVGRIPDGWHVYHRNGNMLDNRAANLYILPPWPSSGIFP